jgi:prolyl-tRNA synthetase
MGSYDLALEGLLACIAEEHHDALGLCWPIHVAPFAVHLVLLADASGIPKGLAERVYADLQANSVEVLYDDREERAGVKFADADLLGVPIRLTVAQRALSQGGVELRLRSRGETERIPPERVVPRVLELRAWLGSAQVPETEGRLRQPAGSGSEGSLGGPEDRERTREEE